MICSTLLSATAAQHSCPSFGLPYTTSWPSNKDSLPPSTLRLMAGLSNKIAQWKLTLESLLITNMTIGQGSYLWRNLLIIMQNMPVWGTYLSSSTTDTTHAFPTKRTSTSALSLKQVMSKPRNLGISSLNTERTYNTPKNCKNKPTIEKLSLEVMLSTRRFS